MRRAALPLIISIVLCSGCAVKAPEPPRVIGPAHCAAPAAPVLPRVNGETLLDDPANVAALLERDSYMRRYIGGLRAALDCYDAQVR